MARGASRTIGSVWAMYEIRRVKPDDAEHYRTIRLAALIDTPTAFGAVYDTEVARSDDHWTEKTIRRSQGNIDAIWLAWTGDGEPVGLVGAYRDDEDARSANLISMWVDPAHRGAGLGRRLVTTVVEWARQAGCDAVELWVTMGNEPALAMYRACGFRELDQVQPLPSDASLTEVRMRIDL